MRKIKAKAAVLTIAATMLLTACSNGEGTSSPNLWGEGSAFDNTSKPGAGNSGNTGMDIPEFLPPKPEKKLGMWDVLPEIPVTDASAFTYKYNSELGGMVVTDYLRESPKVRIPDTLEGEPVVSVDLGWEGTQSHKKTITELIVPDSVTYFSLTKTFVDSFQYINVPKSMGVKELPIDLFYACRNSLIGVYLPDGVTKIDDDAFSKCKSLTSVTIPDSVTEIGKSAFSGCTSLTSITIPDSVTTIGGSTFWGCKSLTNVTIPDSVTEIGDGAFYRCENIIVTYKGKTYDYQNIDKLCDLINYGESGMEIKGGVLTSVADTLTEAVIPDSVTQIGDEAFINCKRLTSVTIPNSVTEIGSNAFNDCESLTSVTIPDSVTKIGNSAFIGCESIVVTYKGKTYDYQNINELYDSINYGESGLQIKEGVLISVSDTLTEAVIPDSVTEIGEEAFRDCSSLTSVTIPNSVTKISSSAFSSCDNLTSVTIPDSVTQIGEEAFSGCTSLTSVTIPDSVTKIGEGAFMSCGLTSVTIPDSVTEIGDMAFYFCESLTSITIPDSVTEIGERAFLGCTSLTSVTIPNSVTTIGGSAFDGCTSLTSITIPNSVTKIGNYAFYNCESLTSVTIPDSVNEIGGEAFSHCTSLTSVTIPDGVTKIGGGAFYGCNSLASVTYKGKTYDHEHIYDLYSAINGN